MAFKNDVKTATAGGADVTLFTCPAGAEASIHTLFLDAQGGNAEATLKLTLQATGQTVVFLDGYALTDDGQFTFPKPINMTAGDSLSLSATTSDVVALVSAFQDGATGTTASFDVRGEYDNAATYDTLDVVTLDGTSYVAVNDGVSGSTPPSADWMILAEKGDTGAVSTTIGELPDVTITAPANNNLLAYDTTSSEWINQTPSEAGFASVSISGDYTDLSNTPSIPAAGTDFVALSGGTFTGNVSVTGEFVADSYNESFVTLSGTTPAVNCETGNIFELSTTGNTTFTFTNPPATGTSYGFTLRVTAGGAHTLTWPASVDWPGGEAPEAPADTETDVFVFFTTDGGTNWYGFQAGDALA